MSPFCILLELTMMEVVVTTEASRCAKLLSNRHHQQINSQFLQAGCPTCHPTNSVKALKGKVTVNNYAENLFLKPVRLTRCILSQSRPSAPSGFPFANTSILRATSFPEHKSKLIQFLTSATLHIHLYINWRTSYTNTSVRIQKLIPKWLNNVDIG